MYRPLFSYCAKPPERKWHRSALDAIAYQSEHIPMSRRDMLQLRSRPRLWVNEGRKRLTVYVPHLWRLRRRVERMRDLQKF